jgi:hypothetical protein
MKGQIEWVILHRFSAGKPTDFVEVRCCDNRVWHSQGPVLTFGNEEAEDLDSSLLAQGRFNALVSKAHVAGFASVAAGKHASGTFNFDVLKIALKEAAQKCLAEIQNVHPGQSLCGFAVLTDHDAMTISGVANTREAIACQTCPDMQEEALYNVSAWAHDDGNEWFDIPYRMLIWQARQRMQATQGRSWLSFVLGRRTSFEKPVAFRAFQSQAFKVFVSALAELRSEGAFDEYGNDFVLLVQVADSDQIPEMADVLNADQKFLEGYRAFFEGS